MIAQVLAARHPERVASLTSIMSTSGNPSPRVALGKPRALRAILHRPRNVDDVEQITDHLVRVFGVIGSPGYTSEPQLLRQQLERVPAAAITRPAQRGKLLAILASGDRRPQLARITAPTLVIHGQDDPLLPPAAGIDTARHIRGARLELIPGMATTFRRRCSRK